jgi:hypothetical protein
MLHFLHRMLYKHMTQSYSNEFPPYRIAIEYQM